MTAPSCATCRRREEFRGHDICGCAPEDWTRWDCLAARKVGGPCGPAGLFYIGPVDEPMPQQPPRRTYWQERRAGCLVAAAITIMFWLTVVLWATLGR